MLKERLIRFMYGRYGLDSLGKCTVIVGLAAILIFRWLDLWILSAASWALLIWAYYRMFSKNVYKRSAENRLYLNKTCRLRSWFARQKNVMVQRKIYHIYKCPSCKQKIRIPKGKGKIEVRCPKCSTTFIKNS